MITTLIWVAIGLMLLCLALMLAIAGVCLGMWVAGETDPK